MCTICASGKLQNRLPKTHDTAALSGHNAQNVVERRAEGRDTPDDPEIDNSACRVDTHLDPERFGKQVRQCQKI